MGYYIDRFGDEEKFLDVQFFAIEAKLSNGPVAIGETHDNADGRAVVCDLIVSGAVRKLFLELSKFGPEKALRKDLLGTEIENSEAWGKLQKVISLVDNRYMNAIPFSTLIPLAVKNGVKVYFFDNGQTTEPMKPEGVRIRNESMGQTFKARNDQAAVGSVILVGGSHLLEVPCGGIFEHTVQSTCGIPLTNVFNLSTVG